MWYSMEMINSAEGSSKTRSRIIPLNEEQILCNEALESGEFDGMSDSDWIAMCEQAAARNRAADLGEA
jgi:hypothetical protein